MILHTDAPIAPADPAGVYKIAPVLVTPIEV